METKDQNRMKALWFEDLKFENFCHDNQYVDKVQAHDLKCNKETDTVLLTAYTTTDCLYQFIETPNFMIAGLFEGKT